MDREKRNKKEMMKPLRENILVEVDEADEKTHGGIIIPDLYKEKCRKATVVAVGAGWYNEKKGTLTPLGVKKGDRILIGTNFKGVDLTFDKKKYELIRENYIFGFVK